MNLKKCCLLTACALVALLPACERTLSGTYADEQGELAYRFAAGGYAEVTVLGSTVSGHYRLDSDRVFVFTPQGTVVLEVSEDTLLGPMGLQLHLQDDVQLAGSPHRD